MKRLLVTSVLVGALLAAGQANAQRDRESMLLTFNATYSIAKSAVTQERVGGFGFTLPLEALTLDGQMTAGILWGLSSVHEDLETTPNGSSSEAEYPEAEELVYRSWPIMLTGRYFFGGQNVIGYVGAAIGLAINVSRVGRDDDWIRESRTGFAFAIPAGAMFWAGERVFFNAGYALRYTSKTYLESAWTHSFSLGIGFEFDREATRF